MKKINYPILALIVANIIWGAASPIFKYSLENIPPFSLAFLRFLLASLILYPFIHQSAKYLDLKNKWLWAYAITGITLNISLYFFGLNLTTSINVPIIASCGPILLLIGSALYLRERVKKLTILGTIVSFFGIATIVLEPLFSQQQDGNILGNLLILGATFFYVISTLVGRNFLTEKNATIMTFWTFFIATLTFFPLMVAEFFNNPVWISNMDNRAWVGIIFGGIFSSTIAYVAYDWALAKLPAYKTGIFTYIDPIVAVIIAVPLLGEKITIPYLLGSAFVFLGILIAEHRIHYHPLHKLLNSST